MNDFKYVIDEFADIKILRFQVPDFSKLTLKQKNYVYYLSEAALWGRDITYIQYGKYNLKLRHTLETIIQTYKGEKNSDFDNFLEYTKRFFFSHGFHHHYNQDKFYPKCDRIYFATLLDNSNMDKYILDNNESYNNFKKSILELIYSKEDKTGDILIDNYMDFYDGVNTEEAKAFYHNKMDVNDKTPISFGLNSKLIKEEDILKELVYKENGLHGEIISKIIENLYKALSFAENDQQKTYTKLLIEYYQTGDLQKWDDYSIAWVIDHDSNIDYINGFIEVYEDPIAYKGSYEALVNMKDEKTTRITKIIAENAKWFEDNSPTDKAFKKTDIRGVNAKGIHAITLGGDTYPSSPIGINLPNADWIREKYGSKSVSITNLTDAYNKANHELPASKKGEFVYSKEQLAFEEKYLDEADDLHTHLHECLGHGSGRLLEGVSPNALKEFHSSLEEARADIFALYYIADPKMIELGIVDSLDLAKAYYSSYIRGGLQVQLVRVELGKDIKEAHMVARKLISSWAYEQGRADKVIEKIVKDDKTYFVINDFDRLRIIFGELLVLLQKIKSTGDYEQGKNLVLNYGVKVDYDLHNEVLERYKKLGLKPYGGFINPQIKPILQGNDIVDYQIIYPDDFVKQNIEYSEQYSFIKKN